MSTICPNANSKCTSGHCCRFLSFLIASLSLCFLLVNISFSLQLLILLTLFIKLLGKLFISAIRHGIMLFSKLGQGSVFILITPDPPFLSSHAVMHQFIIEETVSQGEICFISNI